MKEIEPGCTAIFIGLKLDSDLNGSVVKVIEYDERGSEVFEENHWRVWSGAAGRSGPVRERNLMRIDGLKEYDKEKEKDEVPA